MISLASKHEAIATSPLPPSPPGKDRGMKTPLEAAHSPFGGSVAGRILRCPASVGLVEKVPPHLRRESAYAKRGTALHIAIARVIKNECSLEDLIGETIDDYQVTRDDVENSLRPAYDCVAPLLDAPGAKCFLEQRVMFPNVEGAFGTADLIIFRGNRIYVIDFKFGSGVRVRALYPDGDDDVINAQPLFYAVGARHSHPELFAGVKTIVLTIVQPVVANELDAEPTSSVLVTHAELDEFSAVYAATCAEARGPNPRLQRGDHCRFCPARPICPEHTKPLIDLAQLTIPVLAQPNYLQVLAHILTLTEAVKDIGKAAHDQAKAALHAVAAVPGYALTAGRAERRDDERTALAALEGLGLSRDDVYCRDDALPEPSRAESKSSRPQDSSGIFLVRSENARPGNPSPRTGRARAIPLRGTRSLPRREAPMSNPKIQQDVDHDEPKRVSLRALKTIRKEKIDG